MAAQPYKRVLDVALNLIFQLDAVAGMSEVQAGIGLWIAANPIFVLSELSQDEINDTLKKLTACTVATGTDLNCYPRGHDTALCFDLEGNEVP